MNSGRTRMKRLYPPRDPRDRWMENYERELLQLLNSIEREYNLIVVVEGKKDENALRKLGITKPIVKTQSGKNREGLIERIAQTRSGEQEVLILTDFDRDGLEMAEYIERELELRGIPVQKQLRYRIRRLMTNLRHIEQLVILLRRRDSPPPSDPPDQ